MRMASIGIGDTLVTSTPQPPTITAERDTLSVSGAQCSTYTFPEGRAVQKGHARSASHGGGAQPTSLAPPLGSAAGRPSALKSARGHQRAFSHGQISETGGPVRPGHSRVGSKTDFILPPGHKDGDSSGSAATGGSDGTGSGVPRLSAKGHSRQASRSESIYTLRRTAPPSWWRRLLCFVLRRKPRAEHEEQRKRLVVPNHTIPPKTPRKEHPNGKRVNNRVRTTKYTLLSFLPRNLLEQFHRVANLYFIFIVLLNWFPAINAFGKEISMIPVLFVLGVTAVKDLFEDRRRHASDKRINNTTCRIYHSEAGRYVKVLWKDVRVGDLIHLSNNELVPADILLLRCSNPNGLCYIDTSHLDGETNLKQRQVARGFGDKQRAFEPSKFKSSIEVEPPTTKIYKFHGTMIHPSGERVPVGTENLLLRECLLKNSDFVEGIVLYAGHETKAMLNNGGPRYKRSKLERQMNLDVIWCVLILVFLCVVGAIGCKLWLTAYSGLPEPFVLSSLPISYDSMLTFWTFIIILQIMIPLSLYVTLEMCKLLQVYHIHNNSDLYDPLTDKRIECRALNITEELGQIQYIFSDKTGTLTENKMIFRQCTIAGIDYGHPELANEGKNPTDLSILVNPQMQEDLFYSSVLSEHAFGTRHLHATRIQEFLVLLAICNTVVVSQHPHHDFMNASGVIVPVPNVFEQSQNSKQMSKSTGSMSSVDLLTTSNKQTSHDRYARLTESRSVTPSPPLHDHNVSDISFNSDVPSFPVITTETSPSATCLPDDQEPITKINRPKLLNIPTFSFLGNRRNGNLTDEQKVKLKRSPLPSPCDRKPIFEAESPDELALVDAAYSYNCRLVERTPSNVTVSIPMEGMIEFEILNVLPFCSVRKCMSIIVRHPHTHEIILYCKGADSTVLPNLSPVEDDSDMSRIINTTQQQLNGYAKEGLRVLVMAKRVISPADYLEWTLRHKECELSHDNHDRKVRESYISIERNLTLLGATGIEDRLQEGVPETLLALINAGIVVWVLTGDKPETAINIAYSAKLFSPDMELLKLMARSKEAAQNTIACYLEDIDRQFSDNSTNYVDGSTYGNSSSSVSQVVPRTVNKIRKRALVVDGKTLTFILDRRSNLTKPFLRLTKYCNSVLCCRATPLQKAYIVRVVKEELKMRTLAIGDGANDVSMIQTADVGIGISGQEGMQAVMAADFAMSRFKYLERFLLVHGHWSYDRLSRMVLYFFYKNAAFVFLVFWYQLYCGFSGAVMIDQMYLMLYNLFFTSLPPLAIGVYDQDAPEELLLAKPELYRQGRLGMVYRTYSFWLTMADALYQSIAIFFIAQGAYADSATDFWVFGTTITTACMFVMLFHVAMETRSWTILHVGAILFSIGSFYVFSIIYNSVCVNCLGLPSTYWVIQECMCSPVYWLVCILSCVAALLPRLVFKVLKNMLRPDGITRAVMTHRKATRRGEGFLVSWSRSTSASSIFRASDHGNKNNALTTVG